MYMLVITQASSASRKASEGLFVPYDQAVMQQYVNEGTCVIVGDDEETLWDFANDHNIVFARDDTPF